MHGDELIEEVRTTFVGPDPRESHEETMRKQTMTEKRKRLSWGVGIWILYGGFVLFILACVGFASMQSFDLVER